MSRGGVKRFWTEVSLRPAPEGHGVDLDHRPLRTPAKAALILPTLPLAEAVAAEWRAQGETIDPGTLPLTRIANSAIDKVRPQRAEVARLIADYAACDLLCYRADGPETLLHRQRAWDAPLDWAAGTLGARLAVTRGVMPLAQDPAALRVLHDHVAGLEVFALSALHDLVALSGSLVLGLATAEGALSVDDAWRLSRIDEDFQAEQWGADAEAMLAADARLRDFRLALRAWDLCRRSSPGHHTGPAAE